MISKRHFYGVASITSVIAAGVCADKGFYFSTISLLTGAGMCFFAAILLDVDRMEDELDRILDSTP